MLYFANPTTGTAEHIAAGRIGFIDTPAQGNSRPPGVTWCADNGCFSNNFDEQKWWAWLVRHAHDAATCMFAVAPDVVGNAAATLERSLPWLPKIRALGYKAAFVAQDGIHDLPIPWDALDVLFIGGSTAFKLGPHVPPLVKEAKARGKHVHMGRVNSLRRMRYAHALGCDSVDGTYLVFGPSTNLPKLLGWVRDIRDQTVLFTEVP